jgi:hypothetical protein
MHDQHITDLVVGGVDTHKDLLHVDGQDRFLASESFPTTRQGYRRMLPWMRSFGVFSSASAWPSVPIIVRHSTG